MKKSISLLFFLFVITLHTQAQWQITGIPDSLRQSANSVVRLFTQQTTVTSPTSYTVTYHKVVTILNRNGSIDGGWTCCSDNFRQLTSFSGVIYDANGKQLEKLKKSNLGTTSVSEHLATDDVYNYYTPSSAMSYPYTVEYEWQVKGNNGYVDFPVFCPIRNRQSLQSAEYTLTIPADMSIVSHCSTGNWNSYSNDKHTEYKWSLPSMRCFITDYYDEEPFNILPMVMSGPKSFSFAKTTGDMNTWESFGKWFYTLYKGRDILPEDIATKVNSIIADCHTTREKIEALYSFIAENTRYVSIQLGIGGWQPMNATEVSKTGFGDCKALTNYMRALLKVAGVESYPLLVSTTYSRLIPNFPNMHQINHVLLAVPMEKDDILLVECTNPQLPLGYIPESIAGHDALLIKESGGVMTEIKDYTPAQNNESVNADMSVHSNGQVDVHFAWNHTGCCYGDIMSLKTLDNNKCKDRIRKWMSFNDVTINEVKYKEKKAGMSSNMVFDCQGLAKNGKVEDDRIFLTCNPFRKYQPVILHNDRKRPIVIDFSRSWTDTISIKLTEDLSVEAIPEEEHYESAFGDCNLTIKQEANNILVTMSVLFRKGRFSIEHRKKFEDFQQKISRITNKQIVLVRKKHE